MRDVTLLFLVKRNSISITDVCLAMKKRGFGKDRYNGYGGKIEGDETIEDAVKRECREESGVMVSDLEKVAEIEFTFPHMQQYNQRVHAYITSLWAGEPKETEEMKPFWFRVNSIPYEQMWPDDIYWLPQVLEGNKIKAKFTLGEGDTVVSKEVTII